MCKKVLIPLIHKKFQQVNKKKMNSLIEKKISINDRKNQFREEIQPIKKTVEIVILQKK